MIIVFTGVHYGGMLQFTNQLVKTLNEVGHKAIAFIPDLAENDNNNTVLYKNKKTFYLYSKSIKKIVDEIMNLQPSMVIFSENSLICCEVLLRLPHKIKTVLAIHDAHQHPSNSSFFISLVKSFSKYRYGLTIPSLKSLVSSLYVKLTPLASVVSPTVNSPSPNDFNAQLSGT